MVVTGSLPRAALEAMRLRASGAARVEWRGEDGEMRVGFLLSKDAEGAVRNAFIGVSSPMLIARLLAAGARLWSNAAVFEGGVLVVPEKGGVFLHWPEGRREAAALAEAGLEWVRGDHPNGFVPGAALERLCVSLPQACGTVYCDTKWRDFLNSCLVSDQRPGAVREKEPSPALAR